MTPTSVAVVVPVHDEADLLDRCLVAISAAVAHAHRTHPDVAVVTIIVLDACSDASERIAASHGVGIRRIDARRVGTARRVGVESALAELGDPPARDTWISTTDGDSAVPPTWLSHQLDLAATGAGVVLGTVQPDFADLTSEHAAHWVATHPRGRPAGNVHGANLGMRADVYLAAGGFPELDEHEDVALVRAAVDAGARVVVTDEHEVVTSGRFVGRTPGGYAAFVRQMHDRVRRGVA
ncbi:glycosyltransferase family 2 protein [Microbacterium sp. cf332]|uniref:glycosyltransferase n=1 Tax=Microbacterium sp. cf332 TaxID=1761804 RepID=UPI00088D3A13|nr:glycosyltransferase [Microbacterium sp. cf332]SDQ95571.1 Glycosyl transferase family 2 [Microbacterium sp. cf332]